jgi:hypothetical protein
MMKKQAIKNYNVINRALSKDVFRKLLLVVVFMTMSFGNVLTVSPMMNVSPLLYNSTTTGNADVPEQLPSFVKMMVISNGKVVDAYIREAK